jgi:predicted amidohydrolase YtcJ
MDDGYERGNCISTRKTRRRQKVNSNENVRKASIIQTDVEKGIVKMDGNKANLVLINGFVYTVDKMKTKAEAVAVQNGKIVYVGDNHGAERLIGIDTQVIDLCGKMMLPSFFEAHGHASAFVEFLFAVKLSDAGSIAGYLAAIKEFYKKNPKVQSIMGNGWTNTLFPPTGPEKKVLDEISTEIPIALWSEDHHSLWVNSKALELGQINKDTPNPNGGYIERDQTGEATGTLREGAANFVTEVIPDYSVEQYKEAILAYQSMANSLGFTGVLDPMLFEGTNAIKAYRELSGNQELSMYVRGAYAFQPGMTLSEINDFKNSQSNDNAGLLFQINTIKLFKDGVIEGATAYLNEPYDKGAGRPSGYRGEPLWEVEEMAEIISRGEKFNFQIHVHSIGDAATAETLDAFELAHCNVNARHAITHLQLVDHGDFSRFKDLGILGVPDPYWFMKDLYFYNLQIPYLGSRRAEKEYPMASFVKAGVVLASASDFPVTVPPNPLMGMEFGITRAANDVVMEIENTNPDDLKYKEPLWPEESVSLEQMIRSFTYNGAYANFLDHVTGSIEVGKSADLIIIDSNLFEIPIGEIGQSKVVYTLFQGKPVFQDDSFIWNEG